MTDPQFHKLQSNNQELSPSLNEESRTIHLHAQEFQFNADVKFPSPTLTNPDKYKESITHNKNGAFDIILTKQNDTIEYLFRISSVSERQCKSDTTRACQQTPAARPAMGNVADIQIILKAGKLKPGIYQFGNGKSTPITDMMINSRQLYSDPSHGSLGCQTWGKGELNIEKAVYDVNGKLEYLNASLLRVCDRTVPFSPAQLAEDVSQVKLENIKQYTYYASWRSHLILVKK
ncbi:MULTISPECIES: hypothetical protein [unclassified Nostoc]|uniref:hypothetical protein n=1 Tax=unclassified Nostoc TaxID=2593658 RepID=UPI002AD23AE3|nr:hypothetical protein [Nostoc sp. DedQUE03]MDZ7974657.1 hypothetical protein [Nostoc sp. DedQUE03]MDZ8046938.1 hypothetical protein [Nostoc sp. DedQUE02]